MEIHAVIDKKKAQRFHFQSRLPHNPILTLVDGSRAGR